MSRPIAQFRPSRRYALLTLLSLAAAGASAWAAVQWGWTWMVATVLLAATGVVMLVLATRPRIVVREGGLQIGDRTIFWNEIRRVDRIAFGGGDPWPAPLVLRLTLLGSEVVLVLHSGDAGSCMSLLRHVYRSARRASLDGIPYTDFWGEPVTPEPQLSLPRPRLLLAEDEAEVERLFRRLKASGRIDDAGAAGPERSPEHSAGHSMDRGADES